MASLRTRNAALLFKTESQEGVFTAPNAATDGILVESPSLNFSPQNTETNEVTGSLDPRGPIVGGLQVTLSFNVYIKGNGTPGSAPQFGNLLKSLGLAETIVATDITGNTIAAAGAGNFTDSGNGFGPLTVGTVIYVSGFANSNNNGEFLVTASAAGSITVTKADGTAPGLTTEAAGTAITIRRGVAGATASAGTVSSFTAGSAWSNTAQIYQGYPVLLSGNPATPAFASIADYSAARLATLADLFGSTLSTSTRASIPALVSYKPTSAAIPTGSAEFYMDGVRYRLKGCRGSARFEFKAAGACQVQVELSGMFESKTDAPVPAVTYDGTRPGTWRNSPMLINRQAASLETLSLDMGNQLVFPPDPNAGEGFAVPEITERKITGSMDPHARLIATRDIFANFRNGDNIIIATRVQGGNASRAGQRVGLTIPQAFITGYQPGDNQGLATEQTDFFCQGQDSGFSLVFY